MRATASQYLADSTMVEALQKSDSILSRFVAGVGSLQNTYQRALMQFDVQQNSFQRKIDSLQAIKLPTEKLTAQLDSLQAERARKLDELNEKIAYLQDKATKALGEITLPPQLKEQMQKLTQSIKDYKPPELDNIGNLNLQTLNLLKLGEIDLPELPGTDPLKNLDLDQLSEIKTPELKKLGEQIKLPEFGDVTDQIGDVKDLTGKAGEYGEDIQSIGNQVKQPKALDKAAESQMMKIDEVKGLQEEIQKHNGELNGMTGGLSQDALKEKAKALAMEEARKSLTPAFDHFAGKQEALQKAMDKMSKIKGKYPDVKDLTELPKRVPNPMKAKPLIERLVPGVSFQIQKSTSFLLDVNPLVRYKVTGRFAAGLGWNTRLSIEDWKLTNFKKIYGPRSVFEYKWGKGFHFLLSPEIMNSQVPSQLQQASEDHNREWVFATFVGLKKEFWVYKGLRGNTELLYNLVNTHGKSPYCDRLTVRFGFEFPMKKKPKTEDQQ